MADVWDIAQYVETHPEDFEQRWRLAKKLYLAWEYRLALEHLQVLKNEWEDRPNVRRYLGATLFRLQRYDEAIRELEEAAGKWPEDVEVRQQLARVLAAANKPGDAAKVWTDILAIEPEHEFGETVLKKLTAPKVKSVERPQRRAVQVKNPEPRPMKPPSGEVVCQNCGARNGPEFSECWQCHGSLAYAVAYKPDSDSSITHTPVQLRENPLPWVALGLLVVATLSGGLYLTLRTMFPPVPPQVGTRIPVNLAEYYEFDMTMTRLVGGIVLLIGWPIALRIADYLLGLRSVDNRSLAAAGITLGAAAYLFAWLPMPYSVYGGLALPIAALLICVLLFPVRVHQGLMLWLLQGIITVLLIGSVLAAFHGFDLIRDLPLIAREARNPDPTNVRTWKATVPDQLEFYLQRSPSSWLNRHANRIAVKAKTGPITRRAFVELNGGGRVLEFQEMSEGGIAFEWHEIVPGEHYLIIVSGEEGVSAEVEIRALLPVKEAVTNPELDESQSEPQAQPSDAVLDG